MLATMAVAGCVSISPAASQLPVTTIPGGSLPAVRLPAITIPPVTLPAITIPPVTVPPATKLLDTERSSAVQSACAAFWITSVRPNEIRSEFLIFVSSSSRSTKPKSPWLSARPRMKSTGAQTSAERNGSRPVSVNSQKVT